MLILGEAGSGKETVARLIHARSVRSGFPFLKVNCADMPEDLLDVELFGSERGLPPVWPNIRRERLSVPKRNDPCSTRLRKCRSRSRRGSWKFFRIRFGGAQETNLRPRWMCEFSLLPAPRSIEHSAEKRLREDLYYRLSAFTVQVPSLRQRKSEIAILLQHLMHRLSRHYTLPAREFSPVGVFRVSAIFMARKRAESLKNLRSGIWWQEMPNRF